MVKTADPKAWRDALADFVANHCERDPLLDGHMLAPLHDWQRRITGGSLISFLDYATSEEAFERYKVLQKDPITERIFLCITDVPGAVAFNEIVDKHSEKAIWLYKDEWRAFLDRDRNRTLIAGCPPGLTRRNSDCVAPDQAGTSPVRNQRWNGYAYDPGLFGLSHYDAGRYHYESGYLLRRTSEGRVTGYLPVLGGALVLAAGILIGSG